MIRLDPGPSAPTAGGMRGQVLPLFALMIVVIVGFVSLAIDVSSIYAAQRTYRSVADAAALAGAQDLQVAGGRGVTDGSYARARANALAVVRERLGGTASCTGPAGRRICTLDDGRGRVYRVTIVTPVLSNGCETCDIRRSVQVTVARPEYPLTFARVLGFDTFNVGVTSVGGIGYSRRYTIVTLRPSQTGQTGEQRSIFISGGTDVVVRNGDVATNGNMSIDNSSTMQLTDGFEVDYYFRNQSQGWTSPPIGTRIAAPVRDPAYWRPAYEAQRALAPVNPLPADEATCAAVVASLPSNYAPLGISYDPNKVRCYRPGRYTSAVYGTNGLTVPNNEWGIFLPGIYFFETPLVIQGGVIGGYTPAAPGVTLVFEESPGQMKLRTNGAPALAVLLNAGSRSLDGTPGGREASATLGFDGTTRLETEPESPADSKPLTIVVVPNGFCAPLGTAPTVWKISDDCASDETNNRALDLAGNSALYLGGVQYAPEDNVSINASNADGYIGQVWAWTVHYAGGARIIQEGGEAVGPGLLRLDAACTVPGTKCRP